MYLLSTPNDLAPGDFVVLIVLLPVGSHFRHDTQDVTMYESLSLVAIPLPGVLFVGLFLVGLLLFPGFVLGFWFLAVIAYWTAYKSITSTFVAIDYRQPCTIISIHLLLQSNVCNDLAEAMKALDGKKNTFLSPVLGAMMKQVCWHSRRSKAYRGLPEARGQSEAHGDSNLSILLLESLSND